jgi:hypothetical protein
MTYMLISIISCLSTGVIASSAIDVYFIIKIFKDEFGIFNLDSLLTGEWDSENLKTGVVTHHIASVEISKHVLIIFVSLLAIAFVLEKI